ncbi:MAG: hypothetical protein JNM17_20760 [Archangium sp.]|nr:hypothetical protein [Archangium sp.]
MKRVGLLCLLCFAACNRGLADREAERAALARDEAALGAQLTNLARQLNETKGRATAEENRAGRSLSALRAYQVSMVESWKGNPEALAEQKKKITVKAIPPLLDQSLELAQSVAGGEAVERRFARAIEANDPKDIGKMVEWWENAWVAASESEPDEEAPPKVCPTKRTLTCRPIDDDSLWCPDPEQDAAWAMLLENGTLTVARMSNGQTHTVEARLAPRVWLTRVGSGDRGFIVLHTMRVTTFVQQWQTRIETEKSKGKPVESVKANYDADPFTEALFWDDDDLTWLDPSDRDSVEVLKDVQACEAIETIEGIPAPVRERCRKLTAPVAAVDAGTP